MSHEELQELIPSYALDALPADEEMMLRAHLESCRECSLLLEDHVEAAGHLALAAPPVRPPEALLGRVLAEARTTEQVVPIQRQRRPGRLGWPRLAAAVAAAAVIALGAVNLMLASRLADRDRALAEQRRANAILTSPSVSTVSMVGTGDAPRAAGQIFLPPEASSAAIVVTGLPPAGRKVYQLWLLRDGKPIPLEPFRPDRAGSALIYVRGSVGTMEGMAVSLEERGGLPSPKGPIVLRSA